MSREAGANGGAGEAALHEILEALRTAAPEGTCALCARVAQNVAREVRAFFSEYVNDPQARDGWRRARGFCTEHTPLLASLGDALAVAILYADLADQTRARWQEATGSRSGLLGALRRATPAAPSAPCPACAITRAADARNTAALAQALGQNHPPLWEALETGPGLCAAHTEMVIALAPPAAGARLRECESRRLAALQAELEEIIRKNDYRFRGETWGAERDAWLRALQKLKRPNS